MHIGLVLASECFVHAVFHQVGKFANLKGIRAVAQAIGANGISILIPCHRVIGSNHSLTGFAGGIEAKRILLEIEREMSNIKTL